MSGSSAVENTWDDVTSNNELIPSGHQINKAELLFAKIEDTEVQQQIEKT